MNSETKRKLLVLLAVGVLYYIWIRLTGLAIPCMFRKVTGWLCPGCGITTLFLCLSELDFYGAYMANAYLFVTGPFLFIGLFYDIKLKNDKKYMGWLNMFFFIYLAGLIVWWFARNTTSVSIEAHLL